MKLVCPNCCFKFDLEHAVHEVEGRQFVELLMNLPSPVQRPVYNYIKLFITEKHAMTWGKALKTLKELAPMIKQERVTRQQITYSANTTVWLAALSYMTDPVPSTLALPLKSNGYLLSIVVETAKKAHVEQQKAVEQRVTTACQTGNVRQTQASEIKPMPDDIAKKLNDIFNTAKAEASPEKKAEYQQKLQQQIADMKLKMSADELANYEANRRSHLTDTQE